MQRVGPRAEHRKPLGVGTPCRRALAYRCIQGDQVVKTILYGLVTQQHLVDAEVFEGILPTGFITGGAHPPPVDLPTRVVPLEPKVPGDLGLAQQHCRMLLDGRALVMVGYDEHLLSQARKLRIPIYQVPR